MTEHLNRIAMVDWFKAVGMFLIVFGHLDGDFTNTLTLPVRLKQLGVVFFIFIMGWQLASEERDSRTVLFNRLFKIYFWGILFALVLSVLEGIFNGNLCESNYLPFFLGANVFLDYFPANPTTWYIGMYIHVVILWGVLLRRITVTWKILVASVGIEILIRGFLMPSGLFRAYMVVFNWQTVFLAGMFFGQRGMDYKRDRKQFFRGLMVYAVFVVVWFLIVKLIPIERRFPFDLFLGEDGRGMVYFTSACISLVYLGHAWCFFNLAKQLPGSRIIEFFAKNTLIIFILHMPVWYLISPYMSDMFPWHPFRIVMDLVVLYVGIGVLSFTLEKIVPWQKCKMVIAHR